MTFYFCLRLSLLLSLIFSFIQIHNQSFSNSLSLSLSHTHTHTHSLSLPMNRSFSLSLLPISTSFPPIYLHHSNVTSQQQQPHNISKPQAEQRLIRSSGILLLLRDVTKLVFVFNKGFNYSSETDKTMMMSKRNREAGKPKRRWRRNKTGRQNLSRDPTFFKSNFFATSQTVYLFLSRLTNGTARIYFLPPYAAAGIRTHFSRTCTTFMGPFRTALPTEPPRPQL